MFTTDSNYYSKYYLTLKVLKKKQDKKSVNWILKPQTYGIKSHFRESSCPVQSQRNTEITKFDLWTTKCK